MDARIIYLLGGFLLVVLTLRDAFETMILPRRLHGRLRFTKAYYRGLWPLWTALSDRLGRSGEGMLSLFGPLSMLLLFVLWALGMIIGFAFIYQGTGPAHALGVNMYLSGIRFLTLGLGNGMPESSFSQVLAVCEGGVGFGYVAIVISYLPVLYSGFSNREASISRLDGRAGSPPSASELLRRHAGDLDRLEDYLAEWERWSAQLLESHISYPVLGFFRSQHVNQSWLASLTTMLDATALLLAASENACTRQAQLTFAMARHAVVDLAQIFIVRLPSAYPERLPDERLESLIARLRAAGVPLQGGAEVAARLADLRRLYEPHVHGTARHLRLRVPDWLGDPEQPDNWQRSPWERPSPRLPRRGDAPPDRHF